MEFDLRHFPSDVTSSHPVLDGQVNPEGWESKVCWTVSQWPCHEAVTRTPERASSYLIGYRLSAWSACFLDSTKSRGEHRVNRQCSTHNRRYGGFLRTLPDSSGGKSHEYSPRIDIMHFAVASRSQTPAFSRITWNGGRLSEQPLREPGTVGSPFLQCCP